MIGELYERFLALERRERLMRREIAGVRYWHLVRFYVFMRTVLPKFVKLDAAHPDFELPAAGKPTFLDRVAGKFRRWMIAFAGATVHHPGFAFRRRDVLFSMTPRQADLGDGRKTSLLLDFFAPMLKSRSALLEIVLRTGPTRQPFGRRVLWLRESRRRFDACAASREFAETAVARRQEAEVLARLFSEEYGIGIAAEEITAHVDYALLTRAAYLPMFRKLLRRMSPKVVVTAVQYYTPTFILTEAAHELGIAVVELQHGTVYPEHAAYNLPEAGSVYSPDVFLAWGEYWVSQMRNYPNGVSVPVGYPYLERCWDLCPPARHTDGHPLQILFVSQGTVGRELASRAAELRKLLPAKRFSVLYKLHPNETKTWRARYPFLVDSDVEVVENTARNIYQCLQLADVTVGVNSTAVIEGFQWGRKAFVFRDLPGAELMSKFCDGCQAEFVDSASDLAQRLVALSQTERVSGPQFDASRFWRPRAAESIASFIDSQVAEKSAANASKSHSPR